MVVESARPADTLAPLPCLSTGQRPLAQRPSCFLAEQILEGHPRMIHSLVEHRGSSLAIVRLLEVPFHRRDLAALFCSGANAPVEGSAWRESVGVSGAACGLQQALVPETWPLTCASAASFSRSFPHRAEALWPRHGSTGALCFCRRTRGAAAVLPKKVGRQQPVLASPPFGERLNSHSRR